MVPFAGYSMPVQYPSGIKAEHAAVREAAGLFDVSHMGEFLVRGPQALDLVQRISVNDASKIEIGQASVLCHVSRNGLRDRRSDHLSIPRLLHAGRQRSQPRQGLGVGLEAGGGTSTLSWEDASDDTALLALQGPRAREILRPLASPRRRRT